MGWYVVGRARLCLAAEYGLHYSISEASCIFRTTTIGFTDEADTLHWLPRQSACLSGVVGLHATLWVPHSQLLGLVRTRLKGRWAVSANTLGVDLCSRPVDEAPDRFCTSGWLTTVVSQMQDVYAAPADTLQSPSLSCWMVGGMHCFETWQSVDHKYRLRRPNSCFRCSAS